MFNSIKNSLQVACTPDSNHSGDQLEPEPVRFLGLIKFNKITIFEDLFTDEIDVEIDNYL